jgi:ketosteroid isomerase-like protein
MGSALKCIKLIINTKGRVFMNIKLPRSIETYFRAANAHDSRSIADCFTEDAVVHDEGKDYHGLAAIKE